MTPLFLIKNISLKTRLKYFRKYVAFFLLGFTAGAVSINLMIGFNLDKAYIRIEDLKDQTTDQQTQIESLEAELDVQNVSLVKQINVYVLSEDKYVQIEVEDHTKALLKDMVGKEVENLDPIIVYNVLNNRSVEIDGATYELRVKALLICEKIVVYIEPSELENN